jgi:hypothetical protein
MISTRLEKGQFFRTYEDLKSYAEKIFKYTGMSMNSFDMLLGLISSRITYQNSIRDYISSTERLLVTLRFVLVNIKQVLIN